MRSLILALTLAPTRGVAVKTRTAPRDAAAAFFHNPAATVLHETEAFDAAALPTASEIVRPFAGKFKWPYVDVRRSAEGVTRPTAENALQLVRDEHLSLVLRFEELPIEFWPEHLINVVPEEIIDALRTRFEAGQPEDKGTTVHAYVTTSTASTHAALPDEDDTGVLVVQLEGERAWRLEGETEKDGYIYLYTSEIQTTMARGDGLWIPPQKEQVARVRSDMSVHLTIQAGPALAAQMVRVETAPPRRGSNRPRPGPIVEDVPPPPREPEASSMPVFLLLMFLAVSLSVFLSGRDCLKQLRSISVPARGHHRRGSSMEMEKMLDGEGAPRILSQTSFQMEKMLDGEGAGPTAPARVTPSPPRGARRRKSFTPER
jgi:hypothetical protein